MNRESAVLGGWRGGFGGSLCQMQVQQDDDRGQEGCSSSVKFLSHGKEGRLVKVEDIVLVEICKC